MLKQNLANRGEGMNDLQIFKNSEFGEIRTVSKNGEALFVAKDVCDCLDIDNSRQVLSRLDEDEKADVILNDGSQSRNYSAVNEYGLYSLVLGSRKPTAKKFKRWITHDVLPSIRKHGMYATPVTVENMLNNPDYMIEVLQSFKAEKAKRLEAEAKIKLDAPKVLFANSVVTSDKSILVGELAKIIRQNGVDIGQNRLFGFLRKRHYLLTTGESYNMPSQKGMELELFEIKKVSITKGDGSVIVKNTVKVTPKGQIYFVNKFLKG